MRKILAVLLSFAMLFSISVLAVGCGRGDLKIDGNFKEEATQADVDAAVKFLSESVKPDQPVAARSSNLELGVKAEAKAQLKASMDMFGSVMAIDLNGKASAETSELLSYAVKEDALSSAGNANVSIDGKVALSTKDASGKETANSAELKVAVDGNTYLQGLNAYLDGSFEFKAIPSGEGITEEDKIEMSENGKIKFAGESLDVADVNFGEIMAQLKQSIASIDNINLAVSGLIGMKTEGVKLYIDNSETELKVKVSLDADAFLTSVADMVKEYVNVEQIKETLKMNAFDFYFLFNKETKQFGGAEAKVNLSLKQTEAIQVSVQGMKVNVSDIDVSANLHAWIVATDKTAELPSDLNDYKEFSASKDAVPQV